MNPEWSEYLLTQGARIDPPGVADFGSLADELVAAETGSILADLSHWGLIGLAGEDAQAFLHGQVTNSVQGMDPGQAVFAGYCSAKGRLLAIFLVIRRGDDLLLMLPEPLREVIQKRLGMFILRAKVKARDAGDDWVRLGLAGPNVASVVADVVGGALPAAILGVAHGDNAFAVRLGDQRFDLFVRPDSAPAAWSKCSIDARPVGAPVWEGLLINAGIPTILPVTHDQFVPQMANMEILHGVDFKKGCYPGQEIVARTQYLGKLKRRMYLARVDALAAPGDSLFSPDLPGQACGTVVNSAPAAAGGCDLLAVMQSSSHEGGDVRLGAEDGPRLVFKALPYNL
jgi:folate-binding protein YgfZ